MRLKGPKPARAAGVVPGNSPARFDIPIESLQNDLPAGALLLEIVRFLHVECLSDSDTAVRWNELHDQGATAELALDQIIGDDLGVCTGFVAIPVSAPGTSEYASSAFFNAAVTFNCYGFSSKNCSNFSNHRWDSQ